MSLGLTVVTVSLLFRHAPRRRQPGLSWLMVGAGLATALWWLISLLLAAYAAESREFGATYGPLTGVMALLLWANLTGDRAVPRHRLHRPAGSQTGKRFRAWPCRATAAVGGADRHHTHHLPVALKGCHGVGGRA
jgi:hypothetical protein